MFLLKSTYSYTKLSTNSANNSIYETSKILINLFHSRKIYTKFNYGFIFNKLVNSNKISKGSQINKNRMIHILKEIELRGLLRQTDSVPKVVTADEAVSEIKSNNSIFIHSAAATPLILVKSLAKHGIEKKLKNVKLYHIHLEGPPILTHPECYNIFRSNSLFTGSNCRQAIADGAADFIPIFLGEIPQLFRNNLIPLDYALINVSSPDEHGYCTLGTNIDVTLSACHSAKKLIAVINSKMPRVLGHGVIHFSHFDKVVYHSEEPVYLKTREDTEVDISIGKHISENLVEDGSTLQMGIGSIPDAVLKQLHHHKNLGIHSEMISDGIIDLIMNGVVNNTKKNIHPGQTLSSFSAGSQRLYNFLNDNPSVVMVDISYSNNVEVISRNPKVVAINSCLEVDLTGQVVSDSIGPRIYSGIGGQLDFMSGARMGFDGLGKPVLAMASTTKNGDSKIVSLLKPGSGICTTRSHVHYIVTEYGIADLFGKTLIQRAHELIKIAHPTHRATLEEAAFNSLKIMPSSD